MATNLSESDCPMIFSIWIGGKPPKHEFDCMKTNQNNHGITLIATENWVNAEKFIPVESVIEEMFLDARCKKLWDSFPRADIRSDVLRLWYLIKNPSMIWSDSDCVIKNIPKKNSKVLLPSIQSIIEAICRRNGVEPDMSEIHNSSGNWLDVFMIVGNGDPSFFDEWLTCWHNDYHRPGGIAEAVSYEFFDVGIVADDDYSHMPDRKNVKYEIRKDEK